MESGADWVSRRSSNDYQQLACSQATGSQVHIVFIPALGSLAFGMGRHGSRIFVLLTCFGSPREGVDLYLYPSNISKNNSILALIIGYGTYRSLLPPTVEPRRC